MVEYAYPGTVHSPAFGWLVMLAYFLAALLCWRVAGAGPGASLADNRLWHLFGITLAALGLNKQLGLHATLLPTLRQLALQSGWYDARRYYQALFLGLLAMAALFLIHVLIRRYRASGRPIKLAIAGMVTLCTFVIGRAASFHDVDTLLARELGGWQLNWIVELMTIAAVAAAAAWQLRRARAPGPFPRR